jgi:hypothetical protein
LKPLKQPSSLALPAQICLGDLGWYCIRFALWAMNWKLPERVGGRILSEFKHPLRPPAGYWSQHPWQSGSVQGRSESQAQAPLKGLRSVARSSPPSPSTCNALAQSLPDLPYNSKSPTCSSSGLSSSSRFLLVSYTSSRLDKLSQSFPRSLRAARDIKQSGDSTL